MSRLPEWSPQLEALQDQWLQIYWALHQFEAANSRLLALYPQLYDTFGGITGYQLPDFPHAELADALEAMPDNLVHRERIVTLYQKAFSSLPLIRCLDEPPESIYWRYPLLIDAAHRDGLLRHLWAEGFHDVTRWYPSLRFMLSMLVSEPCFESTPGADQLGAEIINLPVDLEIDADTARWLARVVKGYLSK